MDRTKPYSEMIGEKHTVRGVTGRGLFQVTLMDRLRVKGETETEYRHMYCRIHKVIREGEDIRAGRIFIVQVDHLTREIKKRLIPMQG
tara:strand:- start:31956 stop:32219 length:264 start_codon:yes stop_codon:yes gene_type:complete